MAASVEADNTMCVTFVVHRLPNAPSGEWVAGIEASPVRFFPSRHFPNESAAAMDAVAMNVALRRNPWLAAELRRAVAGAR
jgi:hypothetical protein